MIIRKIADLKELRVRLKKEDSRSEWDMDRLSERLREVGCEDIEEAVSKLDQLNSALEKQKEDRKRLQEEFNNRFPELTED